MDSSTITHVAAILVGVIVTLFLVNGATSKQAGTGSTSSAAAAAAAASAAGKKKKKKKAKGANGEAEGGEPPVPAAAPTPAPATSSKKKAAKPKQAAASAPAPAPEAAATSKEDSTAAAAAAAAENGKGKKKKKKKADDKKSANSTKENGSKAGAKTSTTSTSTSNGNTNGSSNGNKENDDMANMIPAHLLEEDSFQPPKKQPEEDWVVEAPKKKKKSQRPKPAKPAATTAAAAPEAAAAAATTTAAAVAPVAAAASTLTDTVSVDAKKVGILIGPKGATMQAIQEATGCTLDINAPPKDEIPARGQPQKAGVVITGPDKESIQSAKRAITELATKGYAKLLQSEDFGEFSISVHPRYLSEIVGPSGRTIQALQTTLDVKITIPSTDWKPNAVPVGGRVPMAKVGIAGTKENCKTCKAAIQSLMQYHHHEITHPGMIHEEVYVPQEFFHCVIGVRGSEIKHIRGNYKVDVYMPGKEGDLEQENVIVVGRQANVDKAITYIQTLMERDTEQRERKYNDEFYG